MRRRLGASLFAAALLAALATDRLGATDGVFPGGDLVGGRPWWLCPALGVGTGISVVTGQALQTFGFLLWAAQDGCLW